MLDKRGRYRSDTYEGYYRGGSAGIIGESNQDRRLLQKDLVLGVDLAGSAKAYSFQAIAEETIINDFFDGTDVLVTFDPLSETGAAFDRRVEGRPLTFRSLEEESPFANAGQEGLLAEEDPGGFLLLRDDETGSTWQALTGRAIDGPLAGTALERLPSFYAFWFAWSDFHPDTELYGGNGG